MLSPIFYLFAAFTILGGIGVIAWKNPVSSALSMVASFVGIAGLFVGLNAFFIGVLQVLVYAGAIMVLFIFIIMLLDLKTEKLSKFNPTAITAAIIIPMMIIFQLVVVINDTPNHNIIINEQSLVFAEQNELTGDRNLKIDANGHKLTYVDATLVADPNAPEGAEGDDAKMPVSKIRRELQDGTLPDVHLIGNKLFTEYNFPLQIIGLLLLVATVGCIVLSKKTHSGSE